MSNLSVEVKYKDDPKCLVEVLNYIIDVELKRKNMARLASQQKKMTRPKSA